MCNEGTEKNRSIVLEWGLHSPMWKQLQVIFIPRDSSCVISYEVQCHVTVISWHITCSLHLAVELEFKTSFLCIRWQTLFCSDSITNTIITSLDNWENISLKPNTHWVACLPLGWRVCDAPTSLLGVGVCFLGVLLLLWDGVEWPLPLGVVLGELINHKDYGLIAFFFKQQ